MRTHKLRAIIALLSAGLLLVAAVTPAAAREPVGSAWGTVRWDARSGDLPGLVSAFRVHDGTPDEASSQGDWGTYRLWRPDPVPGTLTLDVRCVRVSPGWAEFAGVASGASGIYVEGEAWRVSVKDGGRRGAGDEIGMKSHGDDLDGACDKALDDQQFGRKGIITKGDISVRIRR